jgi:hypothetical protein
LAIVAFWVSEKEAGKQGGRSSGAAVIVMDVIVRLNEDELQVVRCLAAFHAFSRNIRYSRKYSSLFS